MEYLYLIEDDLTFKVGRTTNVRKRRQFYKTYHPRATWRAELEVTNAVAMESRAKEILRGSFPQVPGTDEWFFGKYTLQDFTDLVQTLNPHDSFEDGFDDIEMTLANMATERIIDYLGPIEGIMLDAYQGGVDWLEEIKLDVRDLEGQIEFRLDNTRSALLMILCADPEMTLADLISQIGQGWEPVNNPVYDQLALHPLREILDGPIVIPKFLPEI